jgi:hypothetical protein
MRPSQIGLFAGGRNRSVVISSNQTNYNLHTALGSPTSPVNVSVTINSGVVVSSNNTSTPAFDQGSLPAGSRVTLVNNGSLRGMGGAGGAGASLTDDIGTSVSRTVAAAGGAGGTALRLTRPTIIANGAGEIFGGGGGGGGGAGGLTEVELTGMTVIGGGGGGGGRSGSTAPGGSGGTGEEVSPTYVLFEGAGNAGSNGTSAGAGTGGTARASGSGSSGGAGGNGGDWGANGTSGGAVSGSDFGYTLFDMEAFYDPAPPTTSFAAGGAAGKAVDLNGQSITWLSGNTGARVKGAVS